MKILIGIALVFSAFFALSYIVGRLFTMLISGEPIKEQEVNESGAHEPQKEVHNQMLINSVEDNSRKANGELEAIESQEDYKKIEEKTQEELEHIFSHVWRNVDGEYAFSPISDKELIEKYLGIFVSKSKLEIHNGSIDKVVSSPSGCEIDLRRVAPDFSRLTYTLSSDAGLWHNEISLMPNGIEHNTYKTCQLPLYEGKMKYFYFTIGNDKRSQITRKYIQEKYKVEQIDNEFADDDTLNVFVKESVDNEKEYYFLDYLGTANHLSIYNLPASQILSVAEKDMMHQDSIYNNRSYPENFEKLCQEIFSMFKEKHMLTDCETAQYIFNHYYVVGDGSTYFESRKNKESEYSREVYKRYKVEYTNMYNELFKRLIDEDGYKTRWVSELTLYRMVEEEYEDAIYQYTADFLGGQSLDIFIPSLKLGIEYQGIQHYKPIDHFGGENGFRATIERDKKKKLKCRNNGISLIEWKYDEPVSKVLLQKKIAEHNSDLIIDNLTD